MCVTVSQWGRDVCNGVFVWERCAYQCHSRGQVCIPVSQKGRGVCIHVTVERRLYTYVTVDKRLCSFLLQ